MNSGICTVAECDRTVKSRTFCDMHYKRFMKHGDPTALNYSRRDPAGCSAIDCDRTVLARGLCGGHYQRSRAGAEINGSLRPRNKPGETHKVCPGCGVDRPFLDYSTQGGRMASWCKSCRRYGNKKRIYGLSRAAYDAMVQLGCAACGSTERIHIDHDHKTGKVRGALCSPCNLALGHVDDSPERLEALIRYLRY